MVTLTATDLEGSEDGSYFTLSYPPIVAQRAPCQKEGRLSIVKKRDRQFHDENKKLNSLTALRTLEKYKMDFQ